MCHARFTMARLRVVLVAVLGVVGAAVPALGQRCVWSFMMDGGPPARFTHAMAYDSDRGVTVLFGGWGALDDRTWEWDGVEWREVATGGPLPGLAPVMAYDSARGVTVLQSSAYEQTWEWDGAEWRMVATQHPSSRFQPAMAYDRAREVVVLFGGNIAEVFFNETWEWDGAEWRPVSQSGPAPRTAAAMAYDEARGVTVLFGGAIDFSTRVADTWEWDGVEWRQVADTGPSPRSGFALVYDAGREACILFGGRDDDVNHFADAWMWDGVEWTPIAAAAPSPRSHHAMAYDSRRGVTVLFGGWDDEGAFSDTWEFSCHAISLTVEATCPGGGPARIVWEGATPNGRAALLFARQRGTVTIPTPMPCAGTRLGLGADRLQVAWQGRSGPDGSRTLNTAAPGAACGGLVQLLDLEPCDTSHVAGIQ